MNANTAFQVEYLVVVWTEENKELLVSLRQADILKALANDHELTSKGGGVPELQETTGARYAANLNWDTSLLSYPIPASLTSNIFH